MDVGLVAVGCPPRLDDRERGRGVRAVYDERPAAVVPATGRRPIRHGAGSIRGCLGSGSHWQTRLS